MLDTADPFHDLALLDPGERAEVAALRQRQPHLPPGDHARLNVLLGRATRDRIGRARRALAMERDKRRQPAKGAS